MLGMQEVNQNRHILWDFTCKWSSVDLICFLVPWSIFLFISSQCISIQPIVQGLSLGILGCSLGTICNMLSIIPVVCSCLLISVYWKACFRALFCLLIRKQKACLFSNRKCSCDRLFFFLLNSFFGHLTMKALSLFPLLPVGPVDSWETELSFLWGPLRGL